MASDEIQLTGDQQYDEQLLRTVKKLDDFYQKALIEEAGRFKSADDKQLDDHLHKKLKSFNQYWEQAKKQKIRYQELDLLEKTVGQFDPNTHVVVTKEQLDITKQLQSLTSIAKQIDDLHRAQSEADIKEEVKQAFTEVLNPPKKAKKMTPADQFQADVKNKSKERLIQAAKKAAKK
jgi:hypothetical protein